MFTIIHPRLRRDNLQWFAGAERAYFRNRLQFSQSREQLLVDTVEPAVAENYYNIFGPEHRNDSIHNRVSVLLVERRPASPGDRRYYALWLQSLILGDLFEPGNL